MDENQYSNNESKGNQSVSDRLRFLMDNLGIKQVHLANKLGVSPQAIHQLCSGSQQFSKHTPQIAKILNANEVWLQTGEGEPFSNELSTSLSKVLEFPVYRLSQLNTVKDSRARLTGLVPQEKYVTLRNYNSDSIGFYIENGILAPKFEANDVILVEPTSLNQLQGDELVLLYSGELNETIFCYIKKITNEQYVGWLPGSTGNAPNFFNIQASDLIYGVYRECLKTA
jgi:transcriptional regulator with XRE-family HTH domain